MGNIITKSIALTEDTWTSLDKKTKESGYASLTELLQALASNFDQIAADKNKQQETVEHILLKMLLKGVESEPVLMTDVIWDDLQERSISRRNELRR